MEFRTDADGVMRQRSPRERAPQGPQMGASQGESGRPRGSLAQIPPPRQIPSIPPSLRLPADFPFVAGQPNFDPITGTWY